MRFTKRMKKALSFVLSAAMVLTAGAVTNTAKAADEGTCPTFTIQYDSWEGMAATGSGVGITKEDTVSSYGKREYTLTATADDSIGSYDDRKGHGYESFQTSLDKATENLSDNLILVGESIIINKGKANEATYEWGVADAVKAGMDNDGKGKLRISIQNGYDSADKVPALNPVPTTVAFHTGDTITFVINVKDPNALSDEEQQARKDQEFDDDAHEAAVQAICAKLNIGTMSKFTLYSVMNFGPHAEYKYSGGNSPASGTAVTKDGTYTVSAGTLEQDLEGIFSTWIGTDITKNQTVNKDFSVKVDKLTIGSKSYTPASDNVVVKAKAGNNKNNKYYVGQNARWGDTEIDILRDVTYTDHAGKTVTMKDENIKKATGTYRLNVVNPWNAAVNSLDGAATKDYVTKGVTKDDEEGIDAFLGQTVSGKEGDKITYTVTVKGMTKATPANTTKKTGSLKVAKKEVIVAAGKSTTVKATATKASGAAAAEAITATSANKKVATVSVSGSKVKITVPKKATKGASTTVTVKSGSKSAKIKVTVQNPAKKVTAKKKTVKAKKNKKVKLTFKVKATNKDKAVADKITVKTSKKAVAAIVSYKASKGKVVVTVKTGKKAKKGKSAKITLKIGKKSAKTTVKIK